LRPQAHPARRPVRRQRRHRPGHCDYASRQRSDKRDPQQRQSAASAAGGLFATTSITQCCPTGRNGTSFANAGNEHRKPLNKWIVNFDGTIGTFTVSQQAFHARANRLFPGEPRFWIRWNQTVAGSGSTFRQLYQTVIGTQREQRDLRAFRILARTTGHTLAFWAAADSAAHRYKRHFRQVMGTGGSPSGNR